MVGTLRLLDQGSTRTMFPRIRSPNYKNTGSTARDHLAAGRTFRAWLRTGLGFMR